VTGTRHGTNGRRRATGVALKRHLEHLRAGDLRDALAFWAGEDPPPELQRRDLVLRLLDLMGQEGTVYRRVRTLTRKVLDVLLLLLRREGYASDLPGLFRRLPGEEAVRLEYHEAEAGLKALAKRGFIAEVTDRAMATNGRVIHAVPEELGTLLTSLFREETRTIASVFTLAEHWASLTGAQRSSLAQEFPGLAGASSPDEAAAAVLARGAAPLLARLDPALRQVVELAITTHGGVMLRSQWQARRILPDQRWHQDEWARALEGAGVGTTARLMLADYGLACEEEALVVFREVLEAFLERADAARPAPEEVLRAGGDLAADLGAFLDQVRRHPVRVGRDGEVHKAGRRRILDGFVFRGTCLAGPEEVWTEVLAAAEHLGLLATDAEGFLEPRPAAERFRAFPLEQKVQELYRVALEQPGPQGRSLHQREIRTVVVDLIKGSPERWWSGRALAASARHRYLATLDPRGIRDRHRDRFFTAYFSGRETPADLLEGVEGHWLRRLFLLGMLDAGVEEDRPVAWRLSSLGARVLGVEMPGLTTGLKPLVVNPDFEIVVMPEGDVSDVVHTLDAFAQRVKTGEVVHFRLTKESIQAAVVAGRSVSEFLSFLEGRSRGAVPQNVAWSLKDWAGAVAFVTLERGVVLTADDEAALDRMLAAPDLAPFLVRRLGPTEALLKEDPEERRLRAALRSSGVHVRGR
jgi:hypothetical protein